jgi:hypothetical protein
MAPLWSPHVEQYVVGAVARGAPQPQQRPWVQLKLRMLLLTPLGSEHAAAAMALVAHAQVALIRPDWLMRRVHVQVTRIFMVAL